MALLTTHTTLELLGGAVMQKPDQAPLRLERKTAALLAYLALEGATSRSTLSGLLWPDSLEATARGNLRQLLRRLRDGAGADLIAGDDRLLLTDQVSVDAVQLELSAFAGDDAAVLHGAGELLEGVDFEDCTELSDWLLVKREALGNLRVASLERLTDWSEQSGDLRTALLHAEKLLELDAVSEVAHRRVMRLHYLNGDRGAALRAYQRCQQVLMRELGVAPLIDTTALATSINAGQPLESPIRAVRLELPLSVQRPPVLIGREREWAALEEAWDAGLGIAVSGEAGVGKTRLTLEFVASKGQYALVQGRPGDTGVPYSTLARSLRQTLSDHPGLEIAPWVRLELSRLIPSLMTERPSAISSDADKLRFFESLVSTLEPLIESGLKALVMEDLQFADAASLEAGQYLAMRLSGPSGIRLRSLSTYRTGELSPASEALIRQGVSAGLVALIELKPLELPQLKVLLSGLGVAMPDSLSGALSRHSGGNPLFALETLRSLIESGDSLRELPEHLPVPKRLEALVAGRLERLTPAAQRLVRCAAVAEMEFNIDLASSVLETPVLELSQALSELERAQVITDQQFSHDLLSECVLSAIPAPIRAVLHKRTAEHLERHSASSSGGSASSIAKHFSAAGDSQRASAWWLRAAWGFYNLGSTAAATTIFERVYQQSELPAAVRLEAQCGLGVCQVWSNPAASESHLLAVTERAVALNDLPRELEARTALAKLYVICGRLEDGLAQLELVLQRLPSDTAPLERVEIYRSRFWLELRAGQLRQAEQSIDKALHLAPDHPDIENERAMLYWHQGRFAQAAQMFESYRATRANTANAEDWVMVAGNMAWTYWALGRNREAAALIERQLESITSPFEEGLTRSNLATVLTSMAHNASAMAQLERAKTLLERYDLHHSDAWHRTGHLYYRAGLYAPALEALQIALPLARSVGDPYRLSYILATLGAVFAKSGDLERGLATAREALELARRIHFPLATAIALQGLTVVLLEADQASSALKSAREAASLARNCGMVEQLGAARLLEGLCRPKRGAQQALREALEIANANDLTHLAWQAAEALGLREQAAQHLETLQTHSPAGWFGSAEVTVSAVTVLAVTVPEITKR